MRKITLVHHNIRLNYFQQLHLRKFYFQHKSLLSLQHGIIVSRWLKSWSVQALVDILQNFNLVDPKSWLVFTVEKLDSIVLSLAKLLADFCLWQTFLDDSCWDRKQVSWQQWSSHEGEIPGPNEQNFIKFDYLTRFCSYVMVYHQKVTCTDLMLVPPDHDDCEKSAITMALNLVVHL